MLPANEEEYSFVDSKLGRRRRVPNGSKIRASARACATVEKTKEKLHLKRDYVLPGENIISPFKGKI